MRALQIKVSCGKNVGHVKRLSKRTLTHIVATIKSSEDLEVKTGIVRLAEDDPDAQREAKKDLPFFTPSLLRERKRDGLISSQLFIFDFDNVDNLDKLKKKINKHKSLIFSFVSPSGGGLKAVFLLSRSITDPDVYSLAYRHHAQRLAKLLDQEPDMSTCDCCRVCFVSHDPDIFVNQEPKPLRIASDYEVKRRAKASVAKDKKSYGLSAVSDAACFLAERIDNYDDWVRCGLALSTLGEQGRKPFLLMSENERYNDSAEFLNRKFDSFLRAKKTLTMGTFFFLAHSYGWRGMTGGTGSHPPTLTALNQP